MSVTCMMMMRVYGSCIWVLSVRPTYSRRLGAKTAGLIVHHDCDPIFTSYAWTRQLLLVDQARVSYALRGAPDNPEMESFNSRFKEENRSLFADAQDPEQLRAAVVARIRHYNFRRRHSTLGNQVPMVFARGLRRH